MRSGGTSSVTISDASAGDGAVKEGAGRRRSSVRRARRWADVMLCMVLFFMTAYVNVTVSICTFNANNGQGGVFRSVCFSIRSASNVNILCAGAKRCSTVLEVRGPIRGCSTGVSYCCRFAGLFTTVTRALNRNCTVRGRSVFAEGRFGSRDNGKRRFLSRSCFHCFGKERCASDVACLAVARRGGGDHLVSFSGGG